MKERISDTGFRLMGIVMKIMEWLHPHAENRARTFGIQEGMTVVDYGCGPGRYTMAFAELVGKQGKLLAVDLSKLALEAIEKKVKANGLDNVQFYLAEGYDSHIDSSTSDMVIALDMFFMIQNPKQFLEELSRISKPDAILIIDDGHQSREKTKRKITDAGVWKIIEEKKDHLKCKKISETV